MVTSQLPEVRVKMLLKQCPVCGVVYGLPERLDRNRRDDGDTFYCPNGHELVYPEKEESERTKAELQAEIKRLQGELIQVRHECEQAEARASDVAKVLPEGQAPEAADLGAEGRRSVEIAPVAGAEGERYTCPHCQKVYKYKGFFRRHLAFYDERGFCPK